MNVVYFDCFSGASGDMIVAALLDAGAPADTVRDQLASLAVEGFELSISAVKKGGFAATRFQVTLTDQAKQPHRNLKDVIEILDGSGLSRSVKRSASRIFERLAAVEAKVHGTTVDHVRFHEVGAVDALCDVVGALVALELLDIGCVICSPLPTGNGTVTCAHGVLPVPAPATAELLKGVPIAACDEVGELTTPTGAAVLTTLAADFGPLPAMTVTAVGYGAGEREGRDRPNLLRVLVGQTAQDGDADEITVLETNVDDATPQLLAHCMECLLRAGALDVFAVPIHMKKSRSGVILTVLCEAQRAAALERILFAETTTFGVRRSRVDRVKMRRRRETVATPFGRLGLKVGERDGLTTASPEYEECKAAAAKHGVPLKEVIAAANAAWAARTKD